MSPGTNRKEGWLDLRVRLDILEKRKSLAFPGFESQTVQPMCVCVCVSIENSQPLANFREILCRVHAATGGHVNGVLQCSAVSNKNMVDVRTC